MPVASVQEPLYTLYTSTTLQGYGTVVFFFFFPTSVFSLFFLYEHGDDGAGGGVWAQRASRKNAVVPRGNPVTTTTVQASYEEGGRADWCKLIRLDANGCRSAQIGADWCRLMQIGAG